MRGQTRDTESGFSAGGDDTARQIKLFFQRFHQQKIPVRRVADDCQILNTAKLHLSRRTSQLGGDAIGKSADQVGRSKIRDVDPINSPRHGFAISFPGKASVGTKAIGVCRGGESLHPVKNIRQR